MSRSAKEIKVLMAPLPLYRSILRVHRSLPPAMRTMGDDYVKSEFRRHQKIDNPVHIVGFLSEWQQYLDMLKQQSPKKDIFTPSEEWGNKLDTQILDRLSDEQLGQLYELRSEIKKSR